MLINWLKSNNYYHISFYSKCSCVRVCFYFIFVCRMFFWNYSWRFIIFSQMEWKNFWMSSLNWGWLVVVEDDFSVSLFSFSLQKVSMEGVLRFWHCHSQGDIGDSKGIQILNGLKKRSKILMMVESTFFPESLTVSDADQLSLVWNFLCPRQAGSCIDEPGRPTYLWTVLIGHKCIKLFCDWLKVSIEQRLCFSHRSRTHTGAPGFKSCWLQRS